MINRLFVDASEARIDQRIVGVTADGFGEQDVIEITCVKHEGVWKIQHSAYRPV